MFTTEDKIEMLLEAAEGVTHIMWETGHEVDLADLLDCLAVAGYRLVEDNEGLASLAYFKSLGLEDV